MKEEKYIAPLYAVIFLLIVTGFYLVFIFSEIWKITTQKYLVDPSQLIKLDSVVVANKVFREGGGKGNPLHYEFVSQDGHSFTIEGVAYNHLINRDFLADTFQYSGTVLTVYTDAEGYQTFLSDKRFEEIQVYQFSIGNESYVDLKAANTGWKMRSFWGMAVFTVFYLVFLLFIFRAKRASR